LKDRNNFSFFLVLCLIGFISIEQAHARCADTYDRVGRDCIAEKLPAMKQTKILLIDPEKLEELRDKTYFYQTQTGHLGKFTVKSAYKSATECSVFLQATTYIGDKIYNPPATFTIKREYDSWSTDRAGFDQVSANDFLLSIDSKKCVLSTDAAKVTFYKKTIEESLFEGNDTILWTAFFLIGLAVFLVASSIFREEGKFKAQESLVDAESADENKKVVNDIVLKYSRPFFKRYFSPVVSGMKNKKKLREKYRRPLASAGLTKELTPEDFLAFKLFLIIGAPILFIAVREFIEADWPMIAIPVVSVLGFVYPDIWIKGKIDVRTKQMIKNMPFVVDMLALSVEAGLDFMAAIQKVIEKAPPSPLVDEFEIMIKETKIGASRAEGLRQLSWRANCLPISSFCATLIAADSVGASIGPILKTLAGELRQKRSSEAEKAGATAATKILFPMLIFIMPAVFIIIAAPIVLQFVAGN
jgi:tight adherence protein C